MKVLIRVPVLLLAIASSMHAYAQAFPTRPVRIIVGYTPGGASDVNARIVAQGLSEVWGGINAIVENRAGAAGGLATALTAAAAPDGYTSMLCHIGSHAIAPARSKTLPYDHIKDFGFVSLIGTTPNVIVTHPSMALRNLRDVIAYARKHPGKLSYGSSGVGTSPNLSVELLKLMAKIDIVHVPYKGGGNTVIDAMGGQIELAASNLPGPLPFIRSGRLRGLAITSIERNSRTPDIPTVAEQGVPGYDVTSWFGICTQAAVPKPVLEKFRADLVKALDMPDVKKRLSEQGMDVKPTTSEEFLEYVKTETIKWAKVVREANIPPE